MSNEFLEWDLSKILRDVINAAATRDWDRVELKAEDLKVWARTAKKALMEPEMEKERER